jgi:hypothetical protein
LKKVANTTLKAEVRDYHLLALHSGAPAHFLAWSANQDLDLDLHFCACAFELFLPGSEQSSEHRVWHQSLEDGSCEFYLIENTGTRAILSPGKPPADMFLAVHGDWDEAFIKSLESGLKQMKGVNFAYSVPAHLTEKLHWLLGLEECRPRVTEA